MLKAMRGGVQPVAVKVFPMIGPHAARGQQDFAREVSTLFIAPVPRHQRLKPRNEQHRNQYTF